MTETANTAAQFKNCPSCGIPMPVHRDYVAWCNECNWNVQPLPQPKPRNFFEKLYLQLGQRWGQGLFEQLKNGPVPKPTLTTSKVLALLLAALVHLVTLSLLIAGLWLIVTGWQNVGADVLGAVCIGTAWSLLPPRQKVDKHKIVTAEELPGLFKLSGQIAQILGTTNLDGVVINTSYNAGVRNVGWRRKKILYLGLPLYNVLGPQERVALLGHEMAHYVNGDTRRTPMVSAALQTLLKWEYFLSPQSLRQIFVGHGIMALVMMIARWFAIAIAWVLSLFVKAFIFGLSHLLYRSSQRAEYLADYMATTVSGTQAMTSLFDKLQLRTVVELAVQRHALKREKTDIFAIIRQQIADIPGHEAERLRRVSKLSGSKLDATHPPTSYRSEFLQAHPVANPKIVLSEAEYQQENQELARFEPDIQDNLYDQHRARLYR